MEVKEIRLSDIQVSELNTRKDLGAGTEDTGLDELASSIKEKGLLSPITVRKHHNGTYSLIAGQRRFLACKKIGLETIPAIIRDISDDVDATIISLIENVHRADMNPIDKARAYKIIYDKYSDYNKVAKETGVSSLTIRKYLKLLNLAPALQEKLTTANGPAGIETLSKIAETFALDKQEEVLERIGGFKQQIQLEMLKRSGGDVGKLDGLRDMALEGAFDARICRGLDGCNFIPDELKQPLMRAVKDFQSSGDIQSFKDVVKKIKNS
ncbi:MAG: ParB/RepB/Spo0J family partition protein [Euryarchaeota archaeon]|nr:ParB/RepB/Spo0J family partition protein [Euryarchaeota archaeon]